MKKIAFVIFNMYEFGGEQRVLSVVANSLANDYKIKIFTNKGIRKGTVKCELDERISIESINLLPKRIDRVLLRRIAYCSNGLLYNDGILKYSSYSKSTQKNICEKISQFQPDYVVGLSGMITIMLGNDFWNKQKVKLIAWEHNSYEAYFYTKNKYIWRQEKLFSDALAYYDRCVVLNEYIAHKYKETFEYDCNVIYNPRSFTSNEKAELKNKQFITYGRFVKQKGFDLLIESFNFFAQKNKDWKLIILGEGPVFKKIQSKVEQYGLSDRVNMPGYTSDVRKYLLDSSVYLLSSRWEGFPMCITEAYECGLPVIAYDISAMIPLKQNSECIVVEEFDTKAFAEKMFLLAQDVDLRKKMGANAITTAKELSIEDISKKWKDMLQSI